MSDNPIYHRVRKIRNVLATGTHTIGAWNEQLPRIKQADDYLAWVEESISQIPSGASPLVNEGLLDYLDMTEQDVAVLATIPEPPSYIGPVISTSGTATVSIYHEFVQDIADKFQGQPDLSMWAKQTLLAGQRLQAVQQRSGTVNRRLLQLQPHLGELHQQALDAALKAQANTQSPIEAAATLNQLLEQFKGALIERCRGGKGTNYGRLSENLAANSELTRTVVKDGQLTYDTLNSELVGIRTSRVPSTGERVIELLRSLEEHVVVITDALDPDKVGINFFM